MTENLRSDSIPFLSWPLLHDVNGFAQVVDFECRGVILVDGVLAWKYANGAAAQGCAFQLI